MIYSGECRGLGAEQGGRGGGGAASRVASLRKITKGARERDRESATG